MARKPKKTIIKTAVPVERQGTWFNNKKRRKIVTAEDIVEKFTQLYDIDLAVDGSFLLYTEYKSGRRRIPMGGLLPFHDIADFIEHKCNYVRPEFELVLETAQKILDVAKKKESRPYVWSSRQKPKAPSADFMGALANYYGEKEGKNE